MKWPVFVLIIIICILLVIAYSLMVMAHDADERAERMARKWMEANKGIADALKTDTISAERLYVEESKDETD